MKAPFTIGTVGHFGLAVRHPRRSAQWFMRVLGLRKEFEFEEVIEIDDIWADQKYPKVTKTARVGPYGYRWLRVIKKGQELLL